MTVEAIAMSFKFSNMIYLSLNRQEDSAKIYSILSVSTLKHLQEIAVWESRFAIAASTRSSGLTQGVARGEVHLEFCLDMLRNGKFTCICPWSGEALSTVDSLVVQSRPWSVPLYAYKFCGKQSFYILIAGHVTCSIVGALFLERGAYISFSSDRSGNDLANYAEPLIEFLLSNHDNVADYLAVPSRTAGVLVKSYHFAHHLWNELSAVEGIATSDVEMPNVWVLNSPFGSFESIYPGISPDRIVSCAGISFETLVKRALRAGVFWVPLGRTMIPSSLVHRVVESAGRLHPRDVEFSARIREKARFILWVSVRTGTRVCVNQVGAISTLISRAKARFGSVAVIFDGTTPGDPLSAPQHIIEAETSIIDEIYRATNVPFIGISLIGARLSQAVVWGGVIDFYFVNHGTIQHKVGWLHEKPGICHYFRHSGFDPLTFSALNARQGGVVPTYIYGRPIAEDGILGDQRRDLFSYELDVSHLIQLFDRNVGDPLRETNSPPNDMRRAFHITEHFYLHRDVEVLLSRGTAAWASRDISGTIDNFSAAVKLAPKYRKPVDRLIEYLLMSFVAWFRASDLVEARVLALQFILLAINNNNKWVQENLLHEVLLVKEDSDLERNLREIIARFPALHQVFSVELSKLRSCKQYSKDRLDFVETVLGEVKSEKLA